MTYESHTINYFAKYQSTPPHNSLLGLEYTVLYSDQKLRTFELFLIHLIISVNVSCGVSVSCHASFERKMTSLDVLY